jgi:trigger factor
MEITLNKKDNLNATLDIKVVEADYRPIYNQKIRDYTKKVQLKGFRPGHVPVSLVEKMHGKGILVEEINQIVSKNINSYIKNNSLDILGDPLPELSSMSKIDWENQTEFQFTYKLGLLPTFDISFLNSDLNIYEISVSDKTIQETITNLRKQFGVYRDTEISETEDIIYAEAIDLGTQQIYKCILPEFRIQETQRSNFLGLTIGKKIIFDLRTTLADDATIAHVMGVDKKVAETLNGDFEITVERISHPDLAELNNEFYKKVFKGQEIDSYEVFEKQVRENVEKNYNIEATNQLYSDLFKYLISSTPIELPSAFLKDWLYASNEGKLTLEQINNEFEAYSNSLKWDLIKNKVAKDFGIQVENEDLLNRAKAGIAAQFGMDFQNLDDEMAKMVNNWADTMLKKDDGKEYRRIFQELYTEKVLETLSLQFNPKPIKVTIEEFAEIARLNKN